MVRSRRRASGYGCFVSSDVIPKGLLNIYGANAYVRFECKVRDMKVQGPEKGGDFGGQGLGSKSRRQYRS